MNGKKVPDEVAKFIMNYIESVGTLEMLFYMQNNREGKWTATELRSALHSSDQSVETQLNSLKKAGAVQEQDGDPKTYSYNPNNPSLDKVLTDLSAVYKVFPLRVIEIIYSKPKELLKDFSDAFKLRKDTK